MSSHRDPVKTTAPPSTTSKPLTEKTPESQPSDSPDSALPAQLQRRSLASQPPPLKPAQVTQLQRLVGNKMVQRLLARATPHIQRDDVSPREPALDHDNAQMVQMLYAPASENIELLLQNARHLMDEFERSQAGLPETRAATARLLLQHYTLLARLAESAPRGPNGHLMYHPLFDPDQLQPWSVNDARQIDDVPLFRQEQRTQWTAALGDSPPVAGANTPADAPRNGNRAQTTSTPPASTTAPAEAQQQPALDEAPAPQVSANTAAQGMDESEREGENSLLQITGEETERGLGILRSANLAQAVRAVAASGGTASAGATGNLSLLNASSNVWFVGTQLYVLDRSGRIAPGDFHFAFRGGSLVPGGVYFFGQFRIAGQTGQEDAPLLLRLDGGVHVVGGDLTTGRAIHGDIPLIQMARQSLAGNHGIAVIVSRAVPTTRTRSSFRSDFLATELGAVGRYVPRALRAIISQYRQHPGQLPAEMVENIVTSRVQNVIERLAPSMAIGPALIVLGALQETNEWLTLLEMGAYGRSEDEAYFGAQAIARHIVDLTVGQVVGMASGAIDRRLPSAMGGADRPLSHDGSWSTPEPQAVSTGRTPPPPAHHGATSTPAGTATPGPTPSGAGAGGAIPPGRQTLIGHPPPPGTTGSGPVQAPGTAPRTPTTPYAEAPRDTLVDITPYGSTQIPGGSTPPEGLPPTGGGSGGGEGSRRQTLTGNPPPAGSVSSGPRQAPASGGQIPMVPYGTPPRQTLVGNPPPQSAGGGGPIQAPIGNRETLPQIRPPAGVPSFHPPGSGTGIPPSMPSQRPTLPGNPPPGQPQQGGRANRPNSEDPSWRELLGDEPAANNNRQPASTAPTGGNNSTSGAGTASGGGGGAMPLTQAQAQTALNQHRAAVRQYTGNGPSPNRDVHPISDWESYEHAYRDPAIGGGVGDAPSYGFFGRDGRMHVFIQGGRAAAQPPIGNMPTLPQINVPPRLRPANSDFPSGTPTSPGLHTPTAPQARTTQPYNANNPVAPVSAPNPPPSNLPVRNIPPTRESDLSDQDASSPQNQNPPPRDIPPTRESELSDENSGSQPQMQNNGGNAVNIAPPNRPVPPANDAAANANPYWGRDAVPGQSPSPLTEVQANEARALIPQSPGSSFTPGNDEYLNAWHLVGGVGAAPAYGFQRPDGSYVIHHGGGRRQPTPVQGYTPEQLARFGQ